MTNKLSIFLSLWLSGLTAISTASAEIANGSFELGNFNGWRLEMPRGNSEYSRQRQDAGTANVISSWGQQVGMNPLRAALDGDDFAALGTLGSGYFTGNRAYNISLSKKLSLQQGDILSGWSFFYNGDYEAQDSAWVKILDRDGNRVAVPWLECSGGLGACPPNSTPYRSATEWTQWSWEATTTADYILQIGVTTGGDNNMASYGFFDKIFVQAQQNMAVVPEPSSFAIILMGAACLAGFRNKRD